MATTLHDWMHTCPNDFANGLGFEQCFKTRIVLEATDGEGDSVLTHVHVPEAIHMDRSKNERIMLKLTSYS